MADLADPADSPTSGAPSRSAGPASSGIQHPRGSTLSRSVAWREGPRIDSVSHSIEAPVHLSARAPAILVCLTLATTLAAQPAPRPSLAEPSLSPDSREIVFASGGDIWSAPV